MSCRVQFACVSTLHWLPNGYDAYKKVFFSDTAPQRKTFFLQANKLKQNIT